MRCAPLAPAASAAAAALLALTAVAAAARRRAARPSPPAAGPAVRAAAGAAAGADGNCSHAVAIPGFLPLGNSLVRYWYAVAAAALSACALRFTVSCSKRERRRYASLAGPQARCSPLLRRLPSAWPLRGSPADPGAEARAGWDLQRVRESLAQVGADASRLLTRRPGDRLAEEYQAAWLIDEARALPGVAPAIRAVTGRALRQLGAGPAAPCEAVVHYRCADAPFCRHVGSYNLLRYGWYREAAAAQRRAPRSACILMCPGHVTALCAQRLADEGWQHRGGGVCAQLAAGLGGELPAPKVTVSCGATPEADFAAMVGAPLFIGSGSSLSTMAALARSDGVAVLPTAAPALDPPSPRPPMLPAAASPHNVWRRPGVLPGSAGLVQVRRAKWLLHEEVVDYYDAAAVLRLLRSNRSGPFVAPTLRRARRRRRL